jgi:DNA-binding MarR family transcriptional regulator
MPVPPPKGPPPQTAGFLLSRVGTAVQTGFKEVLAGWGLRPLHYLLLLSVQGPERMSQRDLGRQLRIDSGNMVELIDRLEEAGYVTRVRDSQDRRRQFVTMTPAGRTALSAISAAVEAYDSTFFEPISARERVTLARILAKLYAATAEGRGQAYTATPDA